MSQKTPTNKQKTNVDHVAQLRKKKRNHIWPCHVLLTKDK